MSLIWIAHSLRTTRASLTLSPKSAPRISGTTGGRESRGAAGLRGHDWHRFGKVPLAKGDPRLQCVPPRPHHIALFGCGEDLAHNALLDGLVSLEILDPSKRVTDARRIEFEMVG
jgi:hypothetical protein